MDQALGQSALAPALDDAVGDLGQRALGFLERLVAEPSTVGREAGAQDALADELERLGCAVARLPVPDSIGEHPAAGIPQLSYAGRDVVVGRLGTGDGPSLLLNGHVDVVPAGESGLWTSEPFAPERRDGWLYGRGAGDMKGGIAMATLAVDALRAAAPELLDRGSLTLVGTIEEECTGNGTLASILAGVTADAVVIPEPTDLDLLLSGGGVSWFEVDVPGSAGHASEATSAESAIDAAFPVVEALRRFERDLNADRGDGSPYRLNIGTIQAGDWTSSAPSVARLGVRVGHPRSWTHARVEKELGTLLSGIGGDGHHPTLRASGFRAEAYALAPTHPLAWALADTHAAVHGRPPVAIDGGATTDARLYQQVAGIPAVCYGPRARNIHGVDEAVEIASILAGARTLACFIAGWLTQPRDGAADG
jgi:acetylornithine deacetylase